MATKAPDLAARIAAAEQTLADAQAALAPVAYDHAAGGIANAVLDKAESKVSAAAADLERLKLAAGEAGRRDAQAADEAEAKRVAALEAELVEVRELDWKINRDIGDAAAAMAPTAALIQPNARRGREICKALGRPAPNLGPRAGYLNTIFIAALKATYTGRLDSHGERALAALRRPWRGVDAEPETDAE